LAVKTTPEEKLLALHAEKKRTKPTRRERRIQLYPQQMNSPIRRAKGRFGEEKGLLTYHKKRRRNLAKESTGGRGIARRKEKTFLQPILTTTTD